LKYLEGHKFVNQSSDLSMVTLIGMISRSRTGIWAQSKEGSHGLKEKLRGRRKKLYIPPA